MGVPNERLVLDLVELFPALRPTYEGHVADNYDELLPHVFLGDVARYAEALYKNDNREELQRLLDFLDAAWAAGPDEVEELIHVSFMENLGLWEPQKAATRELLGPHLRQVWAHYE